MGLKAELDDEGTTSMMMPPSNSQRSGNGYRSPRGEVDEGAKKSPSSHSSASSSMCSWLFVLRLLDTILLLGLCIAQGSLLNFLIIWHCQTSHSVYLWFLADFAVVIAFVGALATSYQRVVRHVRRAIKSVLPNGIDLPIYGVLPLGYLSWFLYSCVLVAKIVVIFRWGIAVKLDEEGPFTTQLLKLLIGGGASLIFLLLVNAHQPPSNPNDDSRSYVAALCTGTAFEIFDAIAFLDIMFDNESHFLEPAILALASINLILPTISLLRLSLSDFGKHERPAVIGLLYSTLKMLAVEGPYLGIRAYLWNVYSPTTSAIFMLKNILMIVVKLRYIIPEYIYLLVEQRARKKKVEDATTFPATHLEMKTIA